MPKLCIKCQNEFDENIFLKGRSICKDCRSVIGKEKYTERVESKKNDSGLKTCTICEQTKDVQLFRAGIHYCIDCLNEKRRNNDALNRAPPPPFKQVVCPEGYKICKECFVVKLENEFRDKRLKCKKCENKERVAYKRGEIQKQPQVSIEVEEDKFAKQLKASCRIRIRETIPRDYAQQITQENRFGYLYEFLGCDMEFLKRWLRFNYTSEMVDDNYGTYWIMNHVIPIRLFDIQNNFEQNKKSCYSWFNISSLYSTENMRKSISIDKKQLLTHKNRLLQFCAENGIQPDENYLLLCAKHLDAGNPLEPLLPLDIGNYIEELGQ